MQQDSEKIIYEADIAHARGYNIAALELYIKAVFSQLYHTSEAKNPKWAMEQAINCYLKITPSFQIDYTQDLIQQYYSVVRHWYDNKLDDNLSQIKLEINRTIPFEAADDAREELSTGKTSSFSHSLGPFEIGIACGQGIRDEMEDAHLVESFLIENIATHIFHLFCVFDGHGGKTCAQYIAREMPVVLKNELSTLSSFNQVHLYQALVKTCIRLDQKWKSLPFQQETLKDISGTTATIALIKDCNDLWVTNVGDSGATIDDKGGAIQLTESAKPTIPKYYKEIFVRGGMVAYGRVDGTLDMARSIGDLGHPSVSARPTIKNMNISRNNTFLIVACDGLWDVIDSQTALDCIVGKNATDAANHLRALAYQRGSADNITIIVVLLQK